MLDLSGQRRPILGVFVDTGTHDKHTATVDWGDGSGVYNADAQRGDRLRRPYRGAHLRRRRSLHRQGHRQRRRRRTSDVQTFTVTVHNVDPTLTLTPTPPTTISEGSSVGFNATFTDPGFDNPNNPNPADRPAITDPTHESFTYDVNWGDGRDADHWHGRHRHQRRARRRLDRQLSTAATPTPTTAPTPSPSRSTTTTAAAIPRRSPSSSTTSTRRYSVTPTPPTTINEGAQRRHSLRRSPTPASTTRPTPRRRPTGDPLHESFTYDVNWGDGRDAITGMTVSDTNGGPGIDVDRHLQRQPYLRRRWHLHWSPSRSTTTTAAAIRKTFTVTVNNVEPDADAHADAAHHDQRRRQRRLHRDLHRPRLRQPDQSDDTRQHGDPLNESFTYDVDWGDGRDAITGMTVSDTNGGPGVDSTGTFSGSHIYADDGTYLVTVTIHDDNGGSDTKTFTVTVNNVNPTLSVTPTLATPVAINEGGTVGFNATFSDPGFDNPNNPTTPATGDPFNESFTYDVNWGDGRDAITGMPVSDTNGGAGVDSTGTFSGSHTYADDGTYLVTVTIHDDNGGTDTKTFTVTVNNVNPTLSVTPTLAAPYDQRRRSASASTPRSPTPASTIRTTRRHPPRRSAQ